jgi:hypothetical protein
VDLRVLAERTLAKVSAELLGPASTDVLDRKALLPAQEVTLPVLWTVAPKNLRNQGVVAPNDRLLVAFVVREVVHVATSYEKWSTRGQRKLLADATFSEGQSITV